MDTREEKNRRDLTLDADTDTDEERLRLVTANDSVAAHRLFEEYFPRLTAVARSRLSGRLAARLDPEDIVLSAFRSFFVAARNGRFLTTSDRGLWPLLLEITLHKLFRQVARQCAAKRDVRREDAPAISDVASTHGDLPEDVLLREAVAQLLDSLPEMGSAVVQRRLAGQAIDEIAVELQISVKTVRRWLDRARRHLTASAEPLPDTRDSNGGETSSEPQVGHYRDFQLLAFLGQGASGKVYRALRKRDGTLFALKFLRKEFSSDADALVRFVSEADVLRRLKHPGIVKLHGAGATPWGSAFLVLDMHPRGDLRQHAAGAGPRQCVTWTRQAAAAVSAAHDHGIIHGDLKPGNLLLADDERAVVTDFGLALQPHTSSRLTLPQGTPGFLAPELCQPSWGPVSVRTDVFGLGAVLYGLLTGRAVWEASTWGEWWRNIQSPEAGIAPLNSLCPNISPGLSAFCHRALAKNPQQRPESAAAFIEQLRQVEGV